ncbi:MAG: DNA repair protein [Eubacteriales bacterium]|nr:DNA repair protein [Eubacteriales bacterium]
MKSYSCIDLKSFYASCECIKRGKDPFTHPLVVADKTRGENAICLAVTPALRKLGIPGRVRLSQIPKNIQYEIAPPHMKFYLQKSCDVYAIYLKYVSANDIHIYSIDECFLDYTNYLKYYNKDPIELTKNIMDDINNTLSLTAAAGVGTNLFLAKIALDILAKHEPNNIAYLDEIIFNEKMIHHTPITDFWKIGPGIAKRLEKYGIKDMSDIQKTDPKILFNELGKNAMCLIDHSYGIEPCTMKDIKDYTSYSKSLSTSQILFRDYNKDEAFVVLKEMIDLLCLDLVYNNLYCSNIGLYIKYSKDEYPVSKKSENINENTNSYSKLIKYFKKLYDEIVVEKYPIRQVAISLSQLKPENKIQFDIFSFDKNNIKEKKAQLAAMKIKNKFGKNSILKANSLQKEATAMIRNRLVGGHESGETEKYDKKINKENL